MEIGWEDATGFVCIFLLLTVAFVAGLGRLMLWRWNTMVCFRCCCRRKVARPRRRPKPAVAPWRRYPDRTNQTSTSMSDTGNGRLTRFSGDGSGGGDTLSGTQRFTPVTRQLSGMDATVYGGSSDTTHVVPRPAYNTASDRDRFPLRLGNTSRQRENLTPRPQISRRNDDGDDVDDNVDEYESFDPHAPISRSNRPLLTYNSSQNEAPTVRSTRR
jgi:hypothetical protein